MASLWFSLRVISRFIPAVLLKTTVDLLRSTILSYYHSNPNHTCKFSISAWLINWHWVSSLSRRITIHRYHLWFICYFRLTVRLRLFRFHFTVNTLPLSASCTVIYKLRLKFVFSVCSPISSVSATISQPYFPYFQHR